ncbi:MAG: hypothetical protein IJD39_04320 [Clostridia bacterium]|nr:hypothetical protein [Clostridia bacterium]
MGFGYRLLQGKTGFSGHVRAEGEGERIALRGFSHGAACSIFSIGEGAACCMASPAADGKGQCVYQSAFRGRYFIAVGGQVVLWEDEGRQEENYLRACALLTIWKKAQVQPAENPQGEMIEDDAMDEMPKASETDGRRIAAEEKPVEISPAQEKEDYILRRRENEVAAEGLPALFWPQSAEKLRIYFESLPPFAPFDLPGWRFVRAPSPLPGCAYCALGYRQKEDRVCQIAYALPGAPHRPPANLSGYSFLQGRNGQGYWVLLQQTEA